MSAPLSTRCRFCDRPLTGTRSVTLTREERRELGGTRGRDQACVTCHDDAHARLSERQMCADFGGCH